MSDAVFNWATSNFNDAVISGNSDCNVFALFDLNHEVYNSLTSCYKNCRYYNSDSPFPISKQNKQLFMFHANIRSIYKNLETLSDDVLSFFPFLPLVIRLSETKIKNWILSNLDLEGYKPILHADSNTNAGGVGVFVAQNLEATVLGKNAFKLNCEDIWLRIFDKNSNNAFILGVIFCHPIGDVHDFISVLNQKIASFGPKQKCYILGDLNINVDPSKSTESATDYMYMLYSNNCYMPIDKSTRVGNNTNTIINHVITNDTSNIIYPAIFTSDITDHFPTGCFVANPKISTESVNTKKQTFFI